MQSLGPGPKTGARTVLTNASAARLKYLVLNIDGGSSEPYFMQSGALTSGVQALLRHGCGEGQGL